MDNGRFELGPGNTNDTSALEHVCFLLLVEECGFICFGYFRVRFGCTLGLYWFMICGCRLRHFAVEKGAARKGLGIVVKISVEWYSSHVGDF